MNTEIVSKIGDIYMPLGLRECLETERAYCGAGTYESSSSARIYDPEGIEIKYQPAKSSFKDLGGFTSFWYSEANAESLKESIATSAWIVMRETNAHGTADIAAVTIYRRSGTEIELHDQERKGWETDFYDDEGYQGEERVSVDVRFAAAKLAALPLPLQEMLAPSGNR